MLSTIAALIESATARRVSSLNIYGALILLGAILITTENFLLVFGLVLLRITE